MNRVARISTPRPCHCNTTRHRTRLFHRAAARHEELEAVDLLHRLQRLLREYAQPVAVIAVRSKASSIHGSPLHGATLSSFTSVAFHPSPIVAFALRHPSRMADFLNSTPDTEFSVSLLSQHQADVARAFSCPDKYPRPFESIKYHLNRLQAPVIDGSLGWIHGQILSSIPLNRPLQHSASGALQPGESSLFLAQVLDVSSNIKHTAMPLLYHRRRYSKLIDDNPESQYETSEDDSLSPTQVR